MMTVCNVGFYSDPHKVAYDSSILSTVTVCKRPVIEIK